jgi:hypothetical protein
MSTSQPRAIYYPLRANAYGLTSGAQFANFKRRLKVAALLHDQLVLHNGVWTGVAGPRGGYQMHIPPHQAPAQLLRPQTPRERKRAVGGHFSFAVSDTPDGEPYNVIAESEAAVSWQATFEPIRKELPHAYGWIEFENFTLLAPGLAKAKLVTQAIQDDPLLVARYADGFTRHMVAENAAISAVLAGEMGVGVHLDTLHRAVLTMLVAKGQATPVLGHQALVAVLPDVRLLSWEQVDAARDLPGMPRLRSAIAEVEQAALEAAARGVPLDEAIHHEYERASARAVDELSGRLDLVIPAVVGTATSVVLAGLDPAAGAVFGPVLSLITNVGQRYLSQRRTHNSWVTAASELRAMAERTRYKPPD